MIRHYERNTRGTDYVVGDIHGFFSALQAKLDDLGFNPVVDRLFSVGDLVDKGPESEQVVEWLAKPWFHAVRGNHDDFAIRHVLHGKVDVANYVRNGGGWFLALPRDEQVTIADALSTLPFAISVDCPQGKIGIVHAELPWATWWELELSLTIPEHLPPPRKLTDNSVWSRDKIDFEDDEVVPDLYALIVGHEPVAEPRWLGNTYYIDTSGGKSGALLTILNLHELDVSNGQEIITT